MHMDKTKLFDVIAFDADDTLWHTERLYVEALQQVHRLLEVDITWEEFEEKLFQKEMSNLGLYGYGIKSYFLSMMEMAVELAGDQVNANKVWSILQMGKEMLSAKIQLINRVEEVVQKLFAVYPLIIITKGELLEQQAKLERSGIAQYFHCFEVVSNKTPEAYQALFARLGYDPRRVLMVGNSLKSDILPVLELGGQAVYIPYEVTWAHEVVEKTEGLNDFHRLEDIGQLPSLIEWLESTHSGK